MTDVAEIGTVTSLAGYSAVVIGGPLYMGSVDDAVRKFVGKHRAQLGTLPVAAFAVGITPKSPEPGAVGIAMAALKKSVEPLTPVSSVLFAGKLDPTKLSFIQRKLTEMVKSPTGDFRDWNAIAAWARELPGMLKPLTE
jgi:menaquinone-dependent protoporphyrinogen oxidase